MDFSNFQIIEKNMGILSWGPYLSYEIMTLISYNHDHYDI
jgi:hypothetical protein